MACGMNLEGLFWNKVDQLEAAVVMKWHQVERKRQFTEGFGRKFRRIL